MIQQPIPYFTGDYVTFEDTLTTDDPSEALTITRPDGTTIDVTHAELTRVVNDGTDPDKPDGSITYSWLQQLDQSSQWVGQFSATGADAGSPRAMAYVAL